MADDLTPEEESGLVWVTNSGHLDYSCMRDCMRSRPKATKTMTVEELEAQGFYGWYRPKGKE